MKIIDGDEKYAFSWFPLNWIQAGGCLRYLFLRLVLSFFQTSHLKISYCITAFSIRMHFHWNVWWFKISSSFYVIFTKYIFSSIDSTLNFYTRYQFSQIFRSGTVMCAVSVLVKIIYFFLLDLSLNCVWPLPLLGVCNRSMSALSFPFLCTCHLPSCDQIYVQFSNRLNCMHFDVNFFQFQLYFLYFKFRINRYVNPQRVGHGQFKRNRVRTRAKIPRER